MQPRTGVKRIESDDASETPDDLMAVDEAVTLEELSAAYAKLVESDEPPSLPASSLSDESQSSHLPDEPSIAIEPDDTLVVSPRGIVEAILFVGNANNAPLTADELARGMRGVSAADIPPIIDELNTMYRENGHAMRIIDNKAGYHLEVSSDLALFENVVTAKHRETQLNQSAIDCLSLVAYNPGATKDQIDRLWGRPSSSVLNLLVRRDLVRVERTDSEKRSQNRYYPTERFLELVGLETIDDLPVVDSED